jgi:ribulose-bisphosphate carboxylase small chain
MRLTQGTFSFLPDLTDQEIMTQAQYCLDRGWAISLEYCDDPHPRNIYWDMWGQPMFDLTDAAALMLELTACRKAFGDRYIRLVAFDASPGWESLRISIIVNRPADEPGFHLERSEGPGRQQSYAVRAYAADRPAGQRYG